MTDKQVRKYRYALLVPGDTDLEALPPGMDTLIGGKFEYTALTVGPTVEGKKLVLCALYLTPAELQVLLGLLAAAGMAWEYVAHSDYYGDDQIPLPRSLIPYLPPTIDEDGNEIPATDPAPLQGVLGAADWEWAEE